MLAAFVRHTQVALPQTDMRAEELLGHVLPHVRSGDKVRQEAAVRLVNAVIMRCPGNELGGLFDRLHTLNVPTMLAGRVRGGGAMPDSLAHELYELQTHFLSRTAERAMYRYNPQDKDCIRNLAKLGNVLKEGRNPVRQPVRAASR